MATRKKLPKNVVAVSDASDLDPSQFLGRLAMYTLPDEERNGAKLVRAWHKHGLDVDDLPEARQPVHVFQSACASVKARRTIGKDGSRTEITADEVDNNGTCVYQITVKIWDQANKTIEHEQAIRVNFDKQKSTIAFDHLGSKDPRLAEIEASIQAHFDANAKTVPGQKIRNAVRATLLKVGAQNLRRKAGGVYFVPVEWQPNGKAVPTKPILDGLAGVLEELYGNEKADFHTIPLASDEGAQAMVAKHFTLNVREKAEELTVKALNRVRAGKGQRNVRSDLIVGLANDRRKLEQSYKQFADLVTLEKGDIETNLKALDAAMDELQALADAKDKS